MRSITYVRFHLLSVVQRAELTRCVLDLDLQDCFVHVYGPLPESNKYGVVRKPQSFGVCGVCRKPMKVGEDGGAGNGGGGKSSSESCLSPGHRQRSRSDKP